MNLKTIQQRKRARLSSMLGATAACLITASPMLVAAQETDNPIERRLSPGDSLDAGGAFDQRGDTYAGDGNNRSFSGGNSAISNSAIGPRLYQDDRGRQFYMDGQGTRFYAEQTRPMNQPLQGQGSWQSNTLQPKNTLQPNATASNYRDVQQSNRISQPSQRPMLGVGITDAERGVKVDAVQVGSVAAKAGIQPGDTILSINDEPLSGAQSLQQKIGSDVAGKDVKMTILRGGQEQQLTANFPGQEETYSAAKPALDGSEMESLRQEVNQLKEQVQQLQAAMNESRQSSSQPAEKNGKNGQAEQAQQREQAQQPKQPQKPEQAPVENDELVPNQPEVGLDDQSPE